MITHRRLRGREHVVNEIQMLRVSILLIIQHRSKSIWLLVIMLTNRALRYHWVHNISKTLVHHE